MTSSSRTVPSACVSRRILRWALPALRALEPVGQDRHRLAQPPGRDPRLVHAVVVAGDGAPADAV